MYRKTKTWDLTGVYSPPERLYRCRLGGLRYCYLTSLFSGFHENATGGAAEKHGGEAQKEKKGVFLLHLKIGIKCGFLYATRVAKIKCFYIVFVVLLFFL